MSSVSIVIPVRNGASTIEGCLRSALSQEGVGDVEVILVDNGSTDGTCDVAGRLGVKVVHQPKRGRSAARNAGIRAAKGDRIGLLDADCRAPRDWIRTALPFLSESWMGATQARVQKYGQAGPGPEFTQVHYLLPFLDTCAMVIRRDAFEAARGFDEELPRVVDMDYSFRLLACGYALGWIPEVTVVKHHDLSHKQLARRGWDGGVSLSRLNRKWRSYLPSPPTRLWRDSVKSWMRASLRDAIHPLASRGFNATEATLKLAGWMQSELFETVPPETKYEPVTALPSVIGRNRSLVVSTGGGLLLDAGARHVVRLEHPEVLVIRKLVAGERSAERLSRSLVDEAGLEFAAAARITHEMVTRLEPGRASRGAPLEAERRSG